MRLKPEKTMQSVLPEEACDCHMHVFDDRWPNAATASLLSPTASLADYAASVQDPIGCRRHVVVQPSQYGTDNRLLLSVIRDTRRVRGVAVVDANVDERTLDELRHAGIAGVRFNQVQKGATSTDMIERLAPRLALRGLHLQLHARTAELIELAPRLRRLPVDLVIDHYGRVGESPERSATAEHTLLSLLDGGKAWLKLSAPYLACSEQRPPDWLAQFVERMLRQARERLVWGSDWPHATETSRPSDPQLLQWLLERIPGASDRQQIFVENAAALYRFETAA
jgi:predicted TIM-barrel fold metal-dependent hydrolase